MSIASMKADPMMPNMSVTPFATIVSTNASDGVIFCTPETAVRSAPFFFLVMCDPPSGARRNRPRMSKIGTFRS